MASPDWYSVKIPVQGIDTDILVAWLDMSEVHAIIEGELYFEAFVTRDNLKGLLEMMSEKYSFTKDQLDVTQQEDKNWNQLWESSFDPVIIDNIMIRANFHPQPPKEMTDILIQPKMAFGTGHHETTFQMMQKLNSMDVSGANVLDYGCGTGVLSVLALKKPIIHLDAIDIQEEAVENTLE
ncbi:MAG: 50S ribosomal protein L11 methyltransferase, partial [Bacteroidia bacterium]|nr:50S ribosomal protein L11 methyltransferase [Bacteroidia bacterium]